MITADSDELFMLIDGDTLGGRYRVKSIGADAVELIDLVTGHDAPPRAALIRATRPLRSIVVRTRPEGRAYGLSGCRRRVVPRYPKIQSESHNRRTRDLETMKRTSVLLAS